MDEAVIPPHVAVMAPILLSETVMTLKTARFLIAVFRTFAANHAAKSGLRRIKLDLTSAKQQEAYAYAETVIEVRIMNMLSLAGVLGVLWMLDVPSGRTRWLVESAYTTTGQLLIHLIISSVSLFFPEILSQALLDCSSYPPTAKNVAVILFVILDASAHVANAAFLAAALTNKVIAGSVFLFAVVLYKTIDKGLIGLGNSIKIKIDQELREMNVLDRAATEQPVTIAAEEGDFQDQHTREQRRTHQSRKKGKKRN